MMNKNFKMKICEMLLWARAYIVLVRCWGACGWCYWCIAMVLCYCSPHGWSNRIDDQTVFTGRSPLFSDGGISWILNSYLEIICGSVEFFADVLPLYCFWIALGLSSGCCWLAFVRFPASFSRFITFDASGYAFWRFAMLRLRFSVVCTISVRSCGLWYFVVCCLCGIFAFYFCVCLAVLYCGILGFTLLCFLCAIRGSSDVLIYYFGLLIFLIFLFLLASYCWLLFILTTVFLYFRN